MSQAIGLAMAGHESPVFACWLDFDGCFNEELSYVDGDFRFEPLPGTITEHIMELLQGTAVTAGTNVSAGGSACARVQLGTFSNRQDVHMDWRNSCKREHSLGYSSFTAFDAFEAHLRTHVQSQHSHPEASATAAARGDGAADASQACAAGSARARVVLDRFLLQDAAAGCEAGVTWTHGLGFYAANPQLLTGPRKPGGVQPDWPVCLKILHRSLIFQNGAKSGFEMCFGPSTLGAGAKNTSRIQNKDIYATLYLQAWTWSPDRTRHPSSMLPPKI